MTVQPIALSSFPAAIWLPARAARRPGPGGRCWRLRTGPVLPDEVVYGFGLGLQATITAAELCTIGCGHRAPYVLMLSR